MMTELMTGWTGMEIMWNEVKVTGSVVKVMIIAAVKRTLLTVVFIGKHKKQ
jgi:hypothetical protein